MYGFPENSEVSKECQNFETFTQKLNSLGIIFLVSLKVTSCNGHFEIPFVSQISPFENTKEENKSQEYTSYILNLFQVNNWV